MSKTKDKREKRKQEHAEYVWHQAQLRAAMAKTELDLAVETFKELSGEMTEEQKKTLLQFGTNKEDDYVIFGARV